MQNNSSPSLLVIDGGASKNSPLLLLGNIRDALTQAHNLEQSMGWRSKAIALNEVIKAANVSHEIKVEAAELRIRWERKLGEAMAEAPKNKGGQGKIQPGMDGPCGIIEIPQGEQDPTPTLSSMGITKSVASKARALASIPEEQFEEILLEHRGDALEESAKAVDRKLSSSAVIRSHRKATKPDKEPEHSPLIKPMDNWNFNPVVYDRIEVDGAKEEWGYIPGEFYANCLWYWTKDGDKVGAPMAGSGQILKVWEDRETWMRPDSWDIDLCCYDLNPRGPYSDRIIQNDLSQGLPEDEFDYLVMDIPYFGMVQGQYSEKDSDIANPETPESWEKLMYGVAESCFQSQADNGRCTILCPNFRDLKTGSVYLATYAIVQMFEAVGYTLVDKAYASRRIQQAQNPGMARTNKQAKERRIMLTDISEIMTFQKP